LGLYHTTIEIGDLEYSFGSTEDESSGIYINMKNEINNNLTLKGIFFLSDVLCTKLFFLQRD